MATSQKVQIDTYDFGASLTAPTLGALSTGTTITDGTASTCNEQTADSGVYVADFVGADASHLIPAGTYRLRTSVNGKPLKRFVTFAGVDGELVYARSERAAELDPASRVKLDASQPDYVPATAAALAAMRGADNDTLKTLSDQIDGIDGGALTGPFTRTITVTDAADDAPIEAANVRLYRTGETETKPTDADGETSFTTEAATFSYAVTATGYGGASGTIVISANGATTIELTATAVTPPTDPALSAIEVLCLNANFAAASGIDVDFRMSAVATGDQNRAHPGAKKTVTSNGSGIARFEGPQGATIEWKRGTGQQWTAVTLDNDSVTNVTSLIGSP